MIIIKTLTVQELTGIKGGEGISIGLALGISALIIFVCGVIEGITNPRRCGE